MVTAPVPVPPHTHSPTTQPPALRESAEEPKAIARPGAAGGEGRLEALARLAGSVPDPELPVITLEELGVLRAVSEPEPGHLDVQLTPTYTGCPAIEAMASDIEHVLRGAGAERVTVRTVLSPPWSTDDISEEGRRKLAEHGVAPPRPTTRADGPLLVSLSPTRQTEPTRHAPAERTSPPREPIPPPEAGANTKANAKAKAKAKTGIEDWIETEAESEAEADPVRCPLCGSADTVLLSRFSSTACKALRRCELCREPFDHFKEV